MPELRNGFVSLIGGMDERTDSSLLEDTKYAFGLNVTSRGGKIHLRPRFQLISDSLADGEFQGAVRYHLDATERIVFGVAGKVYGIDLSTLVVTDYTAIPGITMNATGRMYMVQAEKYVVVQDGTNRPLIIDDTTATQSAGDQVPVGTKMAYGHGRLFLVVPQVGVTTGLGERFFAAGDIMLPNNVANLLNFTETNYLSGGGAFSLPNEMGFITWLGFLRNIRSGSGLGSLIVMAQGGSSAFAVNTPRNSWQQIDISQVLFFGGGSYAPDGFVNVNNDLVYRARDGLRSLGYTIGRTSGEGATMSNPSISTEVDILMNLDDRTAQEGVSMVYVDDRVLTLCRASSGVVGPSYDAILSFDAEVLSGTGQTSNPIYDGIWTGL